MKVFDLRCGHDHRFEGWFASEADFAGQQSRGLVACPLCNDANVSRLPSAARINLGARPPTMTRELGPGAQTEASGRPTETMSATAGVDLQSAWMQLVRTVLEKTEDVGERFVDEARDMHYGRTDVRGIRGQATPEQASELREEGIEVMPLPIPAALKGPLQ